ncbi:glucarate dehydratase [Nonomuraea sp. KC401]|uniref:glucarate dehydratase family protein n=1 Tax=unclassified Nonomuraea TaxID=2593643 RepID=UPI0010FD0458|nr:MULTISPECIES: glucarate dehydratase family protein [unclassified Nonomuraea]NBE92059.1 glucarate dehydratase [Nonomuraea sp. K271]TLF85135.1 glucarate dehydratase [Nonomuraea sp. KC401]
MIIRQIRTTPVAFRDPPLLNAAGVHEPWALRTIVEVVTDEGLTGLGETYGDSGHLGKVRECAQALIGLDVHDTNTMYARISAITGHTVSDLHGLTGVATKEKSVDRIFSPFEVACLDIRGKAAGVPVVDLLGGRVRDAVPYSAYLFYKWSGHPGEEPDRFGPALDEAGVVEQARLLIKEYGFASIKLKGGVYHPDQEIAAIHALHEAFPGVPLRLDPNAAWTVETSIRVGRELEGALQYLEDPTPGIPGMAEVAAAVPMPLATNMCVVTPDHLPPAIASRAIGVLLLDHHYWGGLVRSSHIASLCDTFGLELSMHSNSHLGISLAAMTHLAAATRRLTFACDTHTPWQNGQDVVTPGALRFTAGAVPLPAGPGLGVELDRDALARMSEQYEKCGIRARDDTTYMQRFEPAFSARRPRW